MERCCGLCKCDSRHRKPAVRNVSEERSIAAAIAAGIERLNTVSDSPRLDAELLLMRAIDVSRSYLIAHPNDELDDAALKRYQRSLERRSGGTPIAYITGTREFWSMELMVSPATLVPRPETELLVEQALGALPRRTAHRVLDLGTGSGAIALAIAKDRPIAEVVATDISAEAISIARENARQHDIDNVSFEVGEWTRPVAGQRFEVIVSNPPYVRDDDPALAALRAEPQEALAGGDDGLDHIRRIVVDARDVIADDGWLFLEHGSDQGEAIRQLLLHSGWMNPFTVKDLAGLERVTCGRAPGPRG